MAMKKVAETLGQEVATVGGNVTVELVSLSEVKEIVIAKDTTIGQFKSDNELDNVKITDTDGVLLEDTDTITANTTLYISASKRNG